LGTFFVENKWGGVGGGLLVLRRGAKEQTTRGGFSNDFRPNTACRVCSLGRRWDQFWGAQFCLSGGRQGSEKTGIRRVEVGRGRDFQTGKQNFIMLAEQGKGNKKKMWTKKKRKNMFGNEVTITKTELLNKGGDSEGGEALPWTSEERETGVAEIYGKYTLNSSNKTTQR